MSINGIKCIYILFYLCTYVQELHTNIISHPPKTNASNTPIMIYLQAKSTEKLPLNCPLEYKLFNYQYQNI